MVVWTKHGVGIHLLLLLHLKLLLERVGTYFLNKKRVLRLSVDIRRFVLYAIEGNLADLYLFHFGLRIIVRVPIGLNFVSLKVSCDLDMAFLHTDFLLLIWTDISRLNTCILAFQHRWLLTFTLSWWRKALSWLCMKVIVACCWYWLHLYVRLLHVKVHIERQVRCCLRGLDIILILSRVLLFLMGAANFLLLLRTHRLCLMWLKRCHWLSIDLHSETLSDRGRIIALTSYSRFTGLLIISSFSIDLLWRVLHGLYLLLRCSNARWWL